MFRDPPSPAGGGGVVEATVKWFNPAKGFGFLSPSDGSGDIFLHVSALQAAGLREVAEGAVLRCEVQQGQKGRQVSRILDVEAGAGPAPRAPRPPMGGGGGGGGGGGMYGRRDAPQERGMPSGPTFDLEGTVKWYNSQKGFGFVTAADGGKDVFVHMSVLRRGGVQGLVPNQPVRMQVSETAKGREATAIWLL